MKTNFKMKEATSVQEAKTSILDVVKENPLWLNKVNDSLFIIIRSIEPENRIFLLNKSMYEKIVDLFVKLKTEYYKHTENTNYNY